MQVQDAGSREALGRVAAQYLAESAERAVRSRGRFTIALSGGSTPWLALRELAQLGCDWSRWHVWQVDERAAPDRDDARNWTHVCSSLLEHVAIPKAHLHPMPVLDADQGAAARAYERSLPGAFDVVQLGLGDDGHTASLLPGDAALAVRDAAVAWTDEYRGHRRMTLSYPTIARALDVVWLIAGAAKGPVLSRVLEGDPSLPASAVGRGVAFVDSECAMAR